MRLYYGVQETVDYDQMEGWLSISDKRSAIRDIVSKAEAKALKLIPGKGLKHVVYRIDGDETDSTPEGADCWEELAAMIWDRMEYFDRRSVRFSIEFTQVLG